MGFRRPVVRIVVLIACLALIAPPASPAPVGGATASSPPDTALGSDAPSFAPGVVHVKFKRGSTSFGRIADYRASATRELAPGLGAMALAVSPGDELATIAELRADPTVEYAAPNYYLRVAAGFPDDEGYFRTPDGRLYDPLPALEAQYGLRGPRIPEAWDLARGRDDVVVAVIDTGVYMGIDGRADHPDLRGRLIPGVNLVAGEERLRERDLNGHGTAIAGIIAAIPNNARYAAGVTWNTRVLPIKAFDDQGGSTIEQMIGAVKYAADHGARIVNLSSSYTASPPDPEHVDALRDAIDTYLVARGILVVGTAGNTGGGPREGEPLPPAGFPNVMAVGASWLRVVSDNNRLLAFEERAEFSNRGPWLSVVAPGAGLTVLWGLPTLPEPECSTKDARGNQRGFFCGAAGYRTDYPGTSLASAIASGVASLVMGCHPELTPAQVQAVIERSADQIGAGGYPGGRNDLYGHGRINALRALQAAGSVSRVSVGVRPAGTTRLLLPAVQRGAPWC